jgi:SMC interacting uncharacterized protein involved in chromosome segregation
MSVCVMVRDLGDLTNAVEALINEAKEDAIADAISDMEVQIEEQENLIYELRETIADLRSELDEKDTEINNLHKELMANDE